MASKNQITLETITWSITFIFLLHFRCSNAVKGGYWPPENGLEASDIESTLFTHLFCAFASIDPQTNQLSIPSGCSTFPQTIKQKNPSVKALLSIGGGTEDASNNFKAMASQASSRQAFIDSSISIAISNGYDGLDLDWENQASPEEMNNLADLLNEWRAAINSQSSTLLLTAALHYSPTADSGDSFPAQAIANNLDWVNVMAYDFHDANNSPSQTQAPAALENPSSDVSGSSGVNAWINAGVPANQLVLGFPFYGYPWKLTDPNDNGILAPASGGADNFGTGAIRYSDIKDFISQNSATVVYDDSYVANYCYSGTTWIGYDDTQTIAAKVDYAKNTAGLLGYFSWNIAQDQNWALSTQASQTWGQGVANEERASNERHCRIKYTSILLHFFLFHNNN